MNSNRLSRLLVLSAVAFLLAATPPVFSQARRQPPASDQKKNKRPDQQTEDKQQEPLPPDLAGKPQEAEKVTVTTNIVNVDAVVYNKKTGQPQISLKKDNFAIFVDGVKKDVVNFSTPEAPITTRGQGFFWRRIIAPASRTPLPSELNRWNETRS